MQASYWLAINSGSTEQWTRPDIEVHHQHVQETISSVHPGRGGEKHEIQSEKGANQGDPLVMGWHAVSTQLLVESSRVARLRHGLWMTQQVAGSWMGSYPGTTNSKKLAESGDTGFKI